MKKISVCVLICIVATLGGRFDLHAQTSPAAAGASEFEQFLEDNRTRIEGLDRMAALLRTMPASEFVDLDVILEDVGSDPVALFEWVRTNTETLPYRGALKGALGTLMERRGNTLDRSLLLAELLQRAGHRPKLLNTRLNKPGSAELRKKLEHEKGRGARAGQAPDVDGEAGEREQTIEKLVRETGANREAIAALYESQDEADAEIVALVAEARVQAVALLEKLAPEDRIQSDLFAKALEGLDDHWGVEVESQGVVTTFDLIFGARTGSLAEAGFSDQPTKSFTAAEAIEKFGHRLTLRVVATQGLPGGKEEEHVALEHTLLSARQGLKPFWLGFQALGESDDRSDTDDVSIDEAIAVLAKQDEWLPFIWTNGKAVSNASIRADGSINASPTAPEGARVMNNAFSSLGSALDSIPTGLGKPDDNSAATKRRLIRVHVEFEFDSIDDRTVERREVFDLVSSNDGAADDLLNHARRGGAFLVKHMYLMQSHDVPPDYVLDQLRQSTLSAFELYKRLLQTVLKNEQFSVEASFEALEPPPHLLNAFAHLRQAHDPETIAILTPNLVSQFQEYAVGGGELLSSQGFDIVSNRVAARTEQIENYQRATAVQGIYETLLESFLVSDNQSQANTANRFGDDLRVGRGNEWQKLAGIPPVPAGRLFSGSGGTDQHRSFIAPTDAFQCTSISPGFWSVSNQTGTVLGYSDLGRGSDILEWIIITGNTLLTARSVWQLGQCVLGGFLSMGSCDKFQCVISALSVAAGFWPVPQLGRWLGGSSPWVTVNRYITRRGYTYLPASKFWTGFLGFFANGFFEWVSFSGWLFCEYGDSRRPPQDTETGAGQPAPGEGPVDEGDDLTDYGDPPADEGDDLTDYGDPPPGDEDDLTDYSDPPADEGDELPEYGPPADEGDELPEYGPPADEGDELPEYGPSADEGDDLTDYGDPPADEGDDLTDYGESPAIPNNEPGDFGLSPLEPDGMVSQSSGGGASTQEAGSSLGSAQQPSATSGQSAPPGSGSGQPLAEPASASPAQPAVNAGPIEVRLTADGGQSSVPYDRPARYSDDQTSISVVIRTDDPDRAYFIDAEFIAVSAQGIAANRAIPQAGLERFAVTADEPRTIELAGPGDDGFARGGYRVDLEILGYDRLSIPVEIVQREPDAELLSGPNGLPNRFNLAARAFGGRIVTPVTSGEEALGPVALLGREIENWDAVNLIDGFAVTSESSLFSRNCISCGWKIEATSLPTDVVLRLAGGQAALVDSVVFHPFAGEGGITERPPPRNIELAVSTTGEDDAFETVTQARLKREAAAQLVRFSPVEARYLKIRILDAYSETASLGEVEVLEGLEPADSVLADMPRNLASPDLGGALVYAASKNGDLAGVVDGIASPTAAGWISTDGAGEDYSIFPQDLVFAFRDDRIAGVDRLEINPVSASGRSSGVGPESFWARDVAVAVSTSTSPIQGFREIGSFRIGAVDEYQAVPVGESARFVRLRVLSNDSDQNLVSLGEVRIIEGHPKEWPSILTVNPGDPSQAGMASENGTFRAGGGFDDPEPNNVPAEAIPVELGAPVLGTIGTLDDIDQYSLALNLEEPATLNLELTGDPGIRTALNLFSPSGALISEYDPGRNLTESRMLSWHLAEAGNYRVEVSQPPAAVMLVWDSSGSMVGATSDLEAAVGQFVTGLEPGERANLMSFAGSRVDVLLPEFTDQVSELEQAMDGKFTAFGGTPLFDALGQSLTLLSRVNGNRSAILLSDGMDTSSSTTPQGLFWRRLSKVSPSQVNVIGLGATIQDYSAEFGTTGARQLKHITSATGGQVLFTNNSEELAELYEAIGEELRKPARYRFVASLGSGVGQLSVEAAEVGIAKSVVQPGQVALILDASGSMKRELDGARMIDTAKSVLADLLDELSDESLVSLRVFGHRINEGQPGDCEDSEALVPFVPLDRARLRDRLETIDATGGTTLITHSLRQAISDFGDVKGWKLVVLVTDGEEECDPDIAAAIKEAKDAGIELTLNIVGFALADDELKQQLAVLATAAGGQFFDAGNAEALRNELHQAITLPFEIYDAADRLVGSGIVGDQSIELPAGSYQVRIQTASGTIDVPAAGVRPNTLTRVILSRSVDGIDFEVQQ